MPNHQKKQKQSMRKNKNTSNRKSKSHSRKTKLQRGGVSNACVLDSAMHGGMTHCNSGTNLHNVNPQASLDLDNKFMAYGSPVPLGSNILQGGANRCGDEGVGTSNGKSETFKQYLDGLDKQLGSAMRGGGFSTDPGEFIAGMPVYKAYDDCCPPAIVGGQLKFGAPDQPVCGLGAVKGGGRKNKKSKKHSKKSKNRKTGKKHSHTQRGGDWNSVGRSKPAMYSDAFNGPASVFAYPDDMSKRAFDETQPNYSPNAI